MTPSEMENKMRSLEKRLLVIEKRVGIKRKSGEGRCHYEMMGGDKVFIPGCYGGAVYGEDWKYYCTCDD